MMKTEWDERKAWLESLKVGDEVAVNHGRRWSISTLAERATRKNASSKVFLVNGQWFNRMGSLSSDRWWNSSIEPVTDAVRDAIRRESGIRLARNIVSGIERCLLEANDSRRSISTSAIEEAKDHLVKAFRALDPGAAGML